MSHLRPIQLKTTKTTKDSGQQIQAKKCFMCIANLKGLKDKDRRKAKGNLNFVKFLCIECQRNACMTHRYGDKCLNCSTAQVTVFNFHIN